ncbi:hypothetical protein ABL78_3362 [Leptomonas seymouri]|uniref:Uncharacterized protein n=1 Tax=Leptomonas seymouri TaxID=5684 RepID=A0A0N1HY24_LEPSE|nr:hypothetical protein ABL78_3362 [Leptomonas seymouri]|eukprot:KPI87565.1 hypothetical protein ABL78_3362 [Leptomonas seymouri]
MTSLSSSQAQEPVVLPQRRVSINGDYSRRSSYNMLQGATPQGGAKTAAAIRLGASYDLPSSVMHFLCLSSASNPATARNQLCRQLLLLRDYCVELGNKIKGKELLSLGSAGISKKIEANPEFNCCLEVIIATSLVFTEETEDVAKDTLRNVITKLKAAQDTGDEKVLRAAIVEVVNRVLLCTPMAPPAKDAKSVVEQRGGAAAVAQQVGEESKRGSGVRSKFQKNGAAVAAEPHLRDECLDFLTMEDGAPVLLEGRWKRWLDYYEAGYIRYVERLLREQTLEQERSAAAAAASDAEDREEEDRSDAAIDAHHIESIPIFTARQSYWRSTTSAYAQFCFVLLAIHFVRTTDFSLNYLARVSKLVQYYAFQLDSADGEPIAVRRGPVEGDEDDDEEPHAGQELQQDVLRGSTRSVPTKQPAQPEPKEAEVKGVEGVASTDRSLPLPQYDDSVTRRTRVITSGSVQMEDTPSKTAKPGHATLPRRRSHKCFTTQELPPELRPPIEALMEEDGAAEGYAMEYSRIPSVRHTERLDIAEVSTSRQRASGCIESVREASEHAQDEAVVEALARARRESREL